MTSTSTAVTFLTGYSGRKGLLGLLAFPDMLDPKAMFCRMYGYLDGTWGTHDLEFQCKSITHRTSDDPARRGWWVLGKNGEVAHITGGQVRVEQIPGAGLNFQPTLGYVEAIKNIDGELYVCGYGRQVYRQDGAGWTSIADDILTRDTGTGFFDLDGIDARHVYAVGWKGEIWFHDGQAWRQDDSPTTVHLGAVRCVSEDEVWIAGDKGVILHGRFNAWQLIADPSFTGNWYSIEVFGGKTWLAGSDVLAWLDGDTVRPVDTGLGREFTVHRLHAKDGLLWAIGRADILVFDGQSWKEIIHPDNT